VLLSERLQRRDIRNRIGEGMVGSRRLGTSKSDVRSFVVYEVNSSRNLNRHLSPNLRRTMGRRRGDFLSNTSGQLISRVPREKRAGRTDEILVMKAQKFLPRSLNGLHYLCSSSSLTI